MADVKIQITPDILRNQAVQLQNISGRCSELIARGQTNVELLSDSVSENLSNNLVNKVNSLKKLFDVLSAHLETGIVVANNAAESFEKSDKNLVQAIDEELASYENILSSSAAASSAASGSVSGTDTQTVVTGTSYEYNGTTYVTVNNFSAYAKKQSQTEGNCTSTAWTMGKSMITGEVYDEWSPTYWGSNGAIWNGYKDYLTGNKELLLSKAYEELAAGKPSVIYAYNGNSISSRHAVTVVGLAEGADSSNLLDSDFLVIDPWDGATKKLSEVGFTSYDNQSIITYSDNL